MTPIDDITDEAGSERPDDHASDEVADECGQANFTSKVTTDKRCDDRNGDIS
jgi:hypothetical protein